MTWRALAGSRGRSPLSLALRYASSITSHAASFRSPFFLVVVFSSRFSAAHIAVATASQIASPKRDKSGVLPSVTIGTVGAVIDSSTT